MKLWWDTLIQEGKKFGYFVNETKSWLIAKNDEIIDKETELFGVSTLKFTSEGKRHLGAALGSNNFREQYSQEKVRVWCQEMETLSEYAKTQSHAAYSAFCQGEIHKYTYFIRTIPGVKDFIKPLDDLIRQKFRSLSLISLTRLSLRKRGNYFPSQFKKVVWWWFIIGIM